MPTEPELGQTTDPRALVAGDPAVLADAAQHLARFGDAFARTAHGLKGIDVGSWTGAAADAFHATFHATPQSWLDAADAFGRAAQAMDYYQEVVGWAQTRAADAVAMFEEAQRARVQALTVYNQQVDAYNAAIGAPHTTPPALPAPFVDPGADAVETARGHLDTARAIRNKTAADTTRAIGAATALAPPMPSDWDVFTAQLCDEAHRDMTVAGHLLTGAAEGTEELLRFARTLNPTDPYNMTHPAAYLTNVSDAAAGLVHTAVHPIELVKGVVGTDWGSDPGRALGRLIPTIVLAAATGGGGAAGAATRRGAMSAMEREAAATGDDLAAHLTRQEPAPPPTTPIRASAPPSPTRSFAGRISPPPSPGPAIAKPAGDVSTWNPFAPRQPTQPHPLTDGAAASRPAEGRGLAAADSHAASALEQLEPEAGSISRALDGLGVHDTGLPSTAPPATAVKTPGPMPLVQPTAAEYAAMLQADPMLGAAAKGLDAVEDRLGGLSVHDPGLDLPAVTPAHRAALAHKELSKDAVDFADDVAAARYGADHWNAHAERLSTDQRKALNDYSREPPPYYPTYVDINGALRGTHPLNDEVGTAINKIDESLAQNPTPANIIVSRGTKLDHFPADIRSMVGQVVHEDAYISTSLGSTAFKSKPGIIHLHVPEGTPAMYMEKVSHFKGFERELLLGRDLDWTIDEVIKMDGQYHIYGRINPR